MGVAVAARVRVPAPVRVPVPVYWQAREVIYRLRGRRRLHSTPALRSVIAFFHKVQQNETEPNWAAGYSGAAKLSLLNPLKTAPAADVTRDPHLFPEIETVEFKS